MKFLIVILAVFALVHAKETEEQVIQRVLNARKQCFGEVQIPPDLLKQLKNFEYPDKEPARKFVLCEYQILGIYSPTTGFHTKFFSENCKPKVEGMEHCEALGNGPTPADVRAYKFLQCLLAKNVCADLRKKIKDKAQHG